MHPSEKDRTVANDGPDAEPSLLAQAVLCGRLPQLAQLLSVTGTDVNTQDSHGRTPLLLACYKGWLDGVVLLLQHGARKDIRDKNGRLPLHAVTYSQSLSVLAVIADSCSSAEINTTDNEVMTALHWAAFHGSSGMLAPLLDYGINAFALDIDSKTALHWAAQNNNVACVDILLRHESGGVNLINMRDIGGKTALHCAAAAGSADAMRRLSQERECEIECKDTEKRTPLHWAGGIGRTEAVSLLLDLRADPLATDASGKTPLDYASSAGHADCCGLMEHWVRRKVIERTTKKWSEKIEAAQAHAKAAMLRDGAADGRSSRNDRVQTVAKATDKQASTGSLSGAPALAAGSNHLESDWSVNLSTQSLRDSGSIKAEADLWSRLGALDIAKPNMAFLNKRNGAKDRRKLAPLRVSHHNLAFLSSYGHGLDASPPASDGSQTTLDSLLTSDAAQLRIGEKDLRQSHDPRLPKPAAQGVKRSTWASGKRAGHWDIEGGKLSTDAGSWLSMESFINAPALLEREESLSGDPPTSSMVIETDRQTCAESRSGAAARQTAISGISKDSQIPNGAASNASDLEVSLQELKSKKKPMTRAKHKVYPSFEKPDYLPWTDDNDPFEIMKYISEASHSTNL